MSLSCLSKYRAELFGIAIISIIIFHYTEDYASAFKSGIAGCNVLVLGYYKVISSIGVEAFIFLSGFGLFYSMSNNGNIIGFYKKRIKRLLIPYAIVGIIFWGIWDLVLTHKGIVCFLEDFTFVTFWTEGQRVLWFIGIILIFYILFPIIYKMIIAKNGIIKTLMITVLIYMGNYMLWQTWPDIYANVEIGTMRFPCFVLGALCAYVIKKDIKEKMIIPIIIFIGIGLKSIDIVINISQYYSRVIAMFYAVALMLIVCFLLNKLKFVKFNSIMRMVGDYSLELYMIHVCLRKIMKEIGIYTFEFSIYFFIIIFSILLSIPLHKFIDIIDKYI